MVECGINSMRNLIIDSRSLPFIWSATHNMQWLHKAYSEAIAVHGEAFFCKQEANPMWNENSAM